ncbi:hypothetical protein C8Q76DRAFT_464402 [Earliella scabrosa]|nr:hypothetical protein C8Q76DRAFT_464402 [Earliella scabrosa]
MTMNDRAAVAQTVTAMRILRKTAHVRRTSQNKTSARGSCYVSLHLHPHMGPARRRDGDCCLSASRKQMRPDLMHDSDSDVCQGSGQSSRVPPGRVSKLKAYRGSDADDTVPPTAPSGHRPSGPVLAMWVWIATALRACMRWVRSWSPGDLRGPASEVGATLTNREIYWTPGTADMFECKTAGKTSAVAHAPPALFGVLRKCASAAAWAGRRILGSRSFASDAALGESGQVGKRHQSFKES